ncbi:MAG: LuxR C-terminal-related transcriptional regulator [Treponema sp.]|jgi:LuxR family maltose regulon positive regulatory protein|nr:LuxR C-terminal-related transcriptional regulator [Treponema sp.]
MSRKKQTIHKQYYIPQCLQKQLDRIQDYPLTIIEAPSGFGKTTAVREYTRGQPDVQTYWYTCIRESSSKSWRGIAALFEAVDGRIADGLVKLQTPEPDTLPDMADLLRQCRCRHATYLVIDNYQLFTSKIPQDIINVLSVHGNEKLHIIVITQLLTAVRNVTVHTPRILIIGTASFRFNMESIGRYFKMEGLHIADEDLERIQKNTGGWIAAIRLRLINYRNSLNFTEPESMDSLIESAVWNRLDKTEREFFLGLSLLEKCSPAQAAIIAGENRLPEKINALLQSNVFIFFYHDLYYMHSLLRDYLRTILARDYDKSFHKTMIRRVAEVSAQAGDDYEAMLFYYQIGDYDAILSRFYRYEYLNNAPELGVYDFIALVVQTCPDEVLRKYPRALLDFAFHLVLHDKDAEFKKSMTFLRETLTQAPLMTEAEQRRIEGEIALVMSFTAFNDIRKMSEWDRRALELFDGKPSRFLLPHSPWTFGNASVLCLFWSVSGELEQELEAMDECIPIYSRVVNGHGTGADSMMRAEALFLSGKDADAEALCYKVLYLAEGEWQTSICICAEFILARIALFRGDGEAYFRGIERIRQRGEQHGLFYIRMAELCTAALSLALGNLDEIPSWLTEAESIQKLLSRQAVPFGFIVYGRFLLLKKRYKDLTGIAEALLDGTGVPYMLPRLYGMIYLALVKQKKGMPADADVWINQALETALKDRVYMPFAEQGPLLRRLLKGKRRAGKHQEFAALVSLCKRQEAGVKGIERFFQVEKTPLSVREREVALLARKRYSVRDIAEECFISEHTVKTLLSTIYRKLDIHSRAELENKVF